MEDGLSNNEAFSIVQGKRGYIWIGTSDGLNRYDGYSFKVFRHDQNDPSSISGNFIRAICEDNAGNLWVGTFSNGLNFYDAETGAFKHYRHVPGDPDSLISDSIWSLALTPDGRLLIGTYDSGLDIFSPKTGKFQHFPAGSGPQAPSSNRINGIYVDSHGRVWLASSSGLDLFNADGATRHIKSPDHAVSVWGIAEDAQHKLWLATRGGPYVYTPGAPALAEVPGLAASGNPMRSSFLYAVYVDPQQNVWFGDQQNGIYLLRHGSDHVVNYRNETGDKDSLSANNVWNISKDRAGYIWVATHTGVDILNPLQLSIDFLQPSAVQPEKRDIADGVNDIIQAGDRLLLAAAGAIYQFPLNSSDDSFKTNANIFARLPKAQYGQITAISKKGRRLFAGTEFGDLLAIDAAGHVQHVWRPGSELNQWAPRPIHRIELHEGDELYIATFGNGLLDFNQQTAHATQVAGSAPTELRIDDIVEDLARTGTHTLWAGTFRGLFQIDTSTNHSSLVPLLPGSNEPVIQSLHEDRHGHLWVGSYSGLWMLQLDADGNPLSQPQAIPEFHNTQVLAIEEDLDGRLWLATINSLIRFDPVSGQSMIYGRSQGSPISEYYSYGHTRTSDGRLWFGGGQGALGFLPQDLRPNLTPPEVVLNGVTTYRNNQPAHPQLQRQQPLVLSYLDRISTFDVAATDFGAPLANMYSYRLLGFQSEWTPPNTLHQITFTNLNPGRYRLEVKAANNWGTWSTTPATLDLVVLPPWWRTWWAYTIYLLIVIGSAMAYVYSLKRKIAREEGISASLREANEIKSNFVEKLEVQVKEATLELRETLQGVNLKNAELEIAQRRATEGEQVKSQFLANMSHELRTPLTGVLGYTKLLTSTALSSEQKDYVGTIRQSSEALLAIINDTLDLSRLEAGKLLIDEVDFDLLELIESTMELLAPIAYQKRLELIRVIPPELPLQVRGDPLRLRQVLTNLLSNAIKFTESGSVCLDAKLLDKGERDAHVSFTVTDTGIGIPEGEIGQLFNAYARGKISTRHQVEGTGLGLAICKKLLDLMGGHIGVKSRVGTGTAFDFDLRFRMQKHAAPRIQLPRKLSILLYDRHPLSNAAWRASLTRLGAEVRDVTELESLMSLQAEAAVLALSERELAQLGELKQKFSPSLPPMLILAPRIDRQTLQGLSETLYHRVLSKSAREKTVYLELQSLVQHAIRPDTPKAEMPPTVKPAADAPLVLVADDNRINRRLLVTMLGHAGFRTAEAGNGIELLDLAARGPFQAAILDIHMPGMDGIETAAKLRSTYGEATPPIIAMSADVLPVGEGSPQRGLMDDFLMKPFNEQQLVELLREHLTRRELRRRNAV